MSSKAKKILGIIATIIGIALFAMSLYITAQVDDGKMQVASGQKKVDSINKVMPKDSTVGTLGRKTITDPGQKKINEGKEQIAEFEGIARNLKVAGIFLVIAGIGVILWGRKK